MKLKHIAMVSSTEEKADRFYGQVLGLKRVSTKKIPSELSNRIFNVNSELKIVNYANDDIHFELFIWDRQSIETRRIDHVCFEVANLGAFLETCRKMEVEIVQVPKRDATITFIKDHDGNLFEIKYIS